MAGRVSGRTAGAKHGADRHPSRCRRALGIPLTDHATAVTRARAAVSRISAALDEAHSHGDLKFFNREFHRRRMAARAAGKPFMSYAVAMQKLRRELAGVAAGRITRLMVARVFGEVPRQGGKVAA
jgi:hypothetical protein